MTAPMPSSYEQAVIDAFGIHTEEQIPDVTVEPCHAVGCGNEIRWRFIQTCCGHQHAFCRWHKVQRLATLRRFLAAVDFLTCKTCGVLHVDPTVESTTRVVSL